MTATSCDCPAVTATFRHTPEEHSQGLEGEGGRLAKTPSCDLKQGILAWSGVAAWGPSEMRKG